MRLSNQKGFAVFPVFIATLIAFGIVAFIWFGNGIPGKVEKGSDLSYSPKPTLGPQEAEQEFMATYTKKYPEPTSLPIPTELEDELFQILLEANRGYTDLDRVRFKIKSYHGDAAEGTTGAARWIINKVEGKWVLIHLGQEAPKCASLQLFMFYLKDWQGLCFDEAGRLIDGKHPK